MLKVNDTNTIAIVNDEGYFEFFPYAEFTSLPAQLLQC